MAFTSADIANWDFHNSVSHLTEAWKHANDLDRDDIAEAIEALYNIVADLEGSGSDGNQLLAATRGLALALHCISPNDPYIEDAAEDMEYALSLLRY